MSEPNELVIAAEHTPAPRADRDTHLSDRARKRIAGGVAPQTRRAYARQWAAFDAWCVTEDRTALPATAETLAEYITALAEQGYSYSTLEQAMAAIRTMHRTSGHKGQPDTEAAVLVLRDYRRTTRRRKKKAAPATIDPLRAMVATTDPDTPKGLRDRVVLLLGFALYGRRSELVSLDLADLTETDDGLVVLITASKTDQDAEGEEVAIPYGQHPDTCPVRTVRAWRALLAELDITTGRLLRSVSRHGRIGESLSDRAVDRIVKDCAVAAELPGAENFSAHSLRRGGASQSYRGGAPVAVITKHGRWAEGSAVVLGYIDVEDQWRNNPIRGTGM